MPALALAGRRTDTQIDRQLYSAVPGRRNRVVGTLAPEYGSVPWSSSGTELVPCDIRN